MRPAEGGLVRATDARAATTRAEAARWHWVRERWHDGAGLGPAFTPAPERYHWPRESLLAGMRAVRLAPLPGYTGPPKGGA